MDISEGTATEDLWTPYKELVAVVEGYLTREGNGPPYAVHTFEAVLRRHKQTFLSLLKNPPKNPTSRDEIRRGISEGVNLPSIGRTLLSKELVEEAIILSDMYSVNEYLSLELVHTAQRQAPRHPGLPRGLVAVVLYYDGKRSLAQALKEIVMAQDGVSWSINARDEIIKYVTRYVEQLVSGGLLGACLDALQTFSLGAELELLQANRALPPRSHYAPLVDTIETTRKLLAGVVFAASAQRGLSRDILLRLLAEQTNAAGQREFDEISLSLHMALLYALDLSVLHRREDGEELAKKLPLIQDPELISALLDELAPPTNPNQSAADAGEKTSSGIRALCQLSLGLALAALKRAPQSLLRSSGQELRADLLDHDEALVDAAVDGKVFEYIDEVLLSTTAGAVVREEYYQRRLHALLTDFVLLMHSKLTEMRVKADEASRAVQMYSSEGVAAPPAAAAARSRFDAFLRCIEKLYQNDPRRLRDDYWQACDTVQSHTYRSGGRSATLYKLVRLLCSLSGGTLSRGLRALASLAAPPAWPLLCGAPVSAHHLLTALLAYRQNLRVDANPFSDQLQASSLGATAIVTPAARPGRLQVRQEEVEAMMAALKVIAAVAREDQAACIAICENLQWDAVNVMFGLISCHIPLQLKAELCLTLAALGGFPATAPRVAAALDAAQLVSSDSRGRGLAADLAEVECRIEEYPLSRAFLTLLISLSKNSPMALAGAALEPCTRHALELALRHQHRSYAKPVEKTQILSLCLELLVLWLSSYTPSSADLTGRAPPPLHVALRLHSGDELLRMILTTLREAVDELPNRGPQQPYIEKCAIHCLQLLERGLAMERALAQAAGAAGRALVVVGLSKLLLGVPKEECPLLAACRALSTPAVRVWAPAVALLTRCCSPAAAARLLPHADTYTRHGFVEVLEADEWAEGAGDSLRQAKEGILQLLHQTLPYAAPNFAHFLLGYQLSEDVSRSCLNEPGAGGFPLTCLHSILDLLDQHIAPPNNEDRQATDLIESCYRLVHQLCARPATAPPALRFLRTREHFLCRHLQATVNLENATPATLSSRSWVLRACAHEAGAAARDHSALATLLRATHQPQQEWERCLLRRALLGLPVVVAPAPEPRWELFHATQLRAALAQCDVTTGMGGKRISVSRVHALLARELLALHATPAMRTLVSMEIQKVLDYVTEVNRRRNLAATVTHYYDSWRQLTEILFCVAPNEILDVEGKKNLILNILQDLLNKIPPAEVLPQLGNLASGTVLLLLVNLRHCYIMQKRESSLKSTDFESTFFGPSNQIMQTKSLTLKFILQKILSWIIVSSGSTPKMRVNLYGALLNYLNIVNLKTSPAESYDPLDANETYVSRLDNSIGLPTREESTLKSMVIDVMNEFGDNLCSIVCNDCVAGGHDVCRMVALSCLETLAELCPQSECARTLTGQGYLRSLVDSLLQDDAGLQQALEPNPKSLRVLYVYESKMALIIKLAHSGAGAAGALCGGALACLAQLKALDCHPDIHMPSSNTHSFLPSAADRFRQILLPALSLCDALLTSLGTHNHSCVLHVLHVLLSHVECVDMVLRAAHPSSPPGLLIEVEAITSVIARASNRQVLAAAQADTSFQHAAAGIARIQALMLALIPRFANPASEDDHDNIVYHKIVCNLVLYARNILDKDTTHTLFPPSLGGSSDGGADCGAVLALTQGAVRRCLAQGKLLATAEHQCDNVHTMTLDDMKKLLPPDCTLTAPAAVRAAAAAHLRARAQLRRKALRYCRLASEVGLCLVASLLPTYLRTACTPGHPLRGACGDELPALRKGLVAVFNERFTEQLLETAKDQPPSQRCFLEVLLKDIKSMIQYSPL